MADPVQTVTLAIILGTLIAIVYSLRILVLLERRIARMDHHVELLAMSILKDEKKLIADEKQLEKLVKRAIGVSNKGSVSDVKGIGASTAKKLEKAGFDSPAKLAGANIGKVSGIDGIGEKTAKKLISRAKKHTR